MSDMFDICINYPEVMNQAKRLKRLAEQCEDLKRQSQNQAKQIEGCWSGKAADSLKAKLEQLDKFNKNIVNDLNDVATRMETIANEIKLADQESIVRILKI